MPKGLYPLLTELSAIRHKQMIEYDPKKCRQEGKNIKRLTFHSLLNFTIFHAFPTVF